MAINLEASLVCAARVGATMTRACSLTSSGLAASATMEATISTMNIRSLSAEPMTGSSVVGATSIDLIAWEDANLYVMGSDRIYRYQWDPLVTVEIGGQDNRGIDRNKDNRIVTRGAARLLSDGTVSGSLLNALGIRGEIGPVALGGGKVFYATGSGDLITGVQARTLEPSGPGALLWCSEAFGHLESLAYTQRAEKIFVSTSGKGKRILRALDADTGEQLASYSLGFEKSARHLATNYVGDLFGIVGTSIHAWDRDLEVSWTSTTLEWVALATHEQGLYGAAIINENEIRIQELSRSGTFGSEMTIPTDTEDIEVLALTTSPGYLYVAYGSGTEHYVIRIGTGPLEVLTTQNVGTLPLDIITEAGSFGADTETRATFMTVL